MSKGIIVVDIPENCRECKLRTANGYCSLTHRDIFRYRVKGEKANWCPIKSLEDMKDNKDYTLLATEHFKKGWNACLEEIEGR